MPASDVDLGTLSLTAESPDRCHLGMNTDVIGLEVIDRELRRIIPHSVDAHRDDLTADGDDRSVLVGTLTDLRQFDGSVQSAGVCITEAGLSALL